MVLRPAARKPPGDFPPPATLVMPPIMPAASARSAVGPACLELDGLEGFAFEGGEREGFEGLRHGSALDARHLGRNDAGADRAERAAAEAGEDGGERSQDGDLVDLRGEDCDEDEGDEEVVDAEEMAGGVGEAQGVVADIAEPVQQLHVVDVLGHRVGERNRPSVGS